jgi:hypothetical protein
MTPIRKGSNPVKIPFAIKSNDQTFAAWANEVVTAIRQLEARIPTANIGRGSAATSSQFKVSIRLDGATYKVKVRPGYVRTINPDSAATEPVKDWMPTMGGTALDDATAPEMTITDGQTVYCRVTTTEKGVITTAPTIVAADTPEAGVHFQPPSASITGDLYLPIADVSISGSPVVVTITQVQQGGPIVVTPNLPEIKNVGGKFEISKGRISSGDTYDLRTLEQLTGVGEELIKGTAPGTGDTIPFRRIAERASSPQVRVGQISDDIIKVEGNGFDQTFGNLIKNLSVVDGLVTGFSDAEGWYGTLNWEFTPAGGGSLHTMVAIFEGGLLTGVSVDGSPITGELGAEGTATFEANGGTV